MRHLKDFFKPFCKCFIKLAIVLLLRAPIVHDKKVFYHSYVHKIVCEYAIRLFSCR